MKTGLEGKTRGELVRMSIQAAEMRRVTCDVPVNERIHAVWYHAAIALSALVEFEHKRRTFSVMAGLEAWR